MAKAPALAVLLDPLVPWTRALFCPTRHRRNLFFFFEKGTNFHVILSLSCNPRAEASPNKAKKQTNMGKLHLAAERGNIEECQKLLTEVVRSMKDPLGHKR